MRQGTGEWAVGRWPEGLQQQWEAMATALTARALQPDGLSSSSPSTNFPSSLVPRRVPGTRQPPIIDNRGANEYEQEEDKDTESARATEIPAE